MRTRTVRALCASLLLCLALFLQAAAPAWAAPDTPVGGPRLTGTDLVMDGPADVPAPPEVGDAAWLIANATTGEILATRSPHTAYLPASTIKVLTALVLLPRVAPERTIDATAEDVGADGTRVGLVAGLPYTAHQLYQAMLMSSANDATYALSRLNGGRGQTVADMNALAAHLGALDTVVGDPSGLDAPGQQTSVYDLAVIGRAALGNPELMAYAQTPNAHFPGNQIAGGHDRDTFEIGNHNGLLTTYPGAIGLKNGWTTAARRTFIGAATRDGQTYLVTELAGEDPSSTPTRQLLDWAFAYGARVRPVGQLVSPGEVVVTATADAASATPTPTPTPSPTATATALAAAASPAPTAAPALELGSLALAVQEDATAALSQVTNTPMAALALLLAGVLAFTIGRRAARTRSPASLSLPPGAVRAGRQPPGDLPLRRGDLKAARHGAGRARHSARSGLRLRRQRGRHGTR